MSGESIQIIDSSRKIVATARVNDRDGRFAGTVDVSAMPAPMEGTFEEFEEIVNGQMFSFLDEIEDRINGLALRVILGDGRESCVEDLQIYPSSGKVSFRLACSAARKLESK